MQTNQKQGGLQIEQVKEECLRWKKAGHEEVYELWKEFGKSKWNRNSEHAFIGTGVRSKLVEEKGNGKSAQTKKSAFEDERK